MIAGMKWTMRERGRRMNVSVCVATIPAIRCELEKVCSGYIHMRKQK